MLCDFLSTALPVGRWQHVCRRCRIVRETAGPRLVASCLEVRDLRLDVRNSALTSDFRLLTSDRDRRTAICDECTERPPGCWKARDYGCQRAYREAARHAAETADCPLEKLRTACSLQCSVLNTEN
jgi:hypothetical protein